jgi:DNA-binding beta-propeller fold protein YncE
LTTIPNIGYAALAITITPDDEKAFIPLRDSGLVTVVDLITSAVRSITVGGLPGSGPFEIALSPSGSRAYVAIPSSTVAILDTNTELVLGRVGVRARGVAVTTDGGRLYVADSDTRTVSMVNLQDSTVEHINTGADGYANHLAIHVNGKVYVSKAKFDPNSPGTLLTIDTANNLILSEVELEINPFKVATMPRPYDLTPPSLTITATPATLWPPNGKLVPVTIVATITDAGSGVDPNTTIYAVDDEYGSVEPSGSLTLGADGRYSATIPLQASRHGND